MFKTVGTLRAGWIDIPHRVKWSGLTPLWGSAAHAWSNLHWNRRAGSSSTNPLTLYLPVEGSWWLSDYLTDQWACWVLSCGHAYLKSRIWDQIPKLNFVWEDQFSMTCRKCVKEPSLYNPHLVTKELFQPPVMTIVSPSGIPQAPSPVCASSNFSPPWQKKTTILSEAAFKRTS